MRLYTQEEVMLLKERYHNTDNIELGRIMGRSKGSVQQKAMRLGLYKDQSFLNALYKKKIALANSPQSIQKRAETWRGIYKAERRRILFGLPQKTKRKLGSMSRQKRCARARMKKVGYIVTDDHNRIYFTPETRRSVKMERNAEKNGIKVLPIRTDEAVNG